MSPADVIDGEGELLPDGLYWLQPKSAVILEAELTDRDVAVEGVAETSLDSELVPSNL